MEDPSFTIKWSTKFPHRKRMWFCTFKVLHFFKKRVCNYLETAQKIQKQTPEE